MLVYQSLFIVGSARKLFAKKTCSYVSFNSATIHCARQLSPFVDLVATGAFLVPKRRTKAATCSTNRNNVFQSCHLRFACWVPSIFSSAWRARIKLYPFSSSLFKTSLLYTWRFSSLLRRSQLSDGAVLILGCLGL